MSSDDLTRRFDLREAMAPRAGRHRVREGRILVTSALIRSGHLLSAWHGDSGRRYVVSVYGPDGVDALCAAETRPVVLIAVRRTDIGAPEILDARSAVPGLIRSWIAGVFAAGAGELHVHRLAESEDARAAIVADLMPGDPGTDPGAGAANGPEAPAAA